MTVMDKRFYYSINVGKDNPAIIGKCFIFTGAIIGFWSVFAFLLAKGFITMSENALLALVSLFSGGLTLFLAWVFTLPIFKKAASSVKVQAKIIDVKDGQIRNSMNNTVQTTETYTPVVEYEFSGTTYQTELMSSSTFCPEIGTTFELNVSKKDPKKVVTNGNVVFSAIATFVFSCAAILIAIPGIRVLMGYSSGFSTSSNTVTGTADVGEFSIIGGGLALIFFLIGIGICASLKKKGSKKKLMETGIKKTGKIVHISVNENTIINGNNPVKLTCFVEGKNLEIKAKTPAGVTTFREGQLINIYFDPADNSRFYADL